MKKIVISLFTLTFAVVLSACSYKGSYNYITIDLEAYDTVTGYSIAFPKDSTLTVAFDSIIEEMSQDGTLDCFNSYWLGDEADACYEAIDFTNSVYTTTYNGNGTTLKAITSSGYEPFEILDDNGDLAGYDIDLANFIAKELNYNLTWIDAEFDSIIANLTQGKVDLAVAAITPTSERKLSVDFTVEYFFESYTVALFRTDDAYLSIDDMKDKTVAAQSGTVQAELLEQLHADGKVGKVILVNYPATAMQSLKSNKIDVFFVEKSIADGLLEKFN